MCLCARKLIRRLDQAEFASDRRRRRRNNKLCPAAAHAPCIIYVHLDRHDLLGHTHALYLNRVCLPVVHEISTDKTEITFQFTQ
jgi:hypothetical protein